MCFTHVIEVYELLVQYAKNTTHVSLVIYIWHIFWSAGTFHMITHDDTTSMTCKEVELGAYIRDLYGAFHIKRPHFLQLSIILIFVDFETIIRTNHFDYGWQT